MEASRKIVLALLLLTGCMTGSCLMTHDSFEDIQIGTPIRSVEKHTCRPYSIHVKGPEREEYEYIEKIEISSGNTYENHYFLMVEDGVIVSKRSTRARPPSYDFLYSDDPNVFNNY